MRAANMTSRVANEVELHWQLHHPSILELYNYFEDSHFVYLVMEYCSKGELFQFLQKKSSPLSEPEARGALLPIIKGLQYLHNHGIIHRDVKLSNILLTDQLLPVNFFMLFNRFFFNFSFFRKLVILDLQ